MFHNFFQLSDKVLVSVDLFLVFYFDSVVCCCLLLLLLLFSVLFLVSYSPSLGLRLRPRMREGNDYMYLFFAASFWWYLSVTLIILTIKYEQFRKVKFFVFPHLLGLPGILFMYLSVLFLIITRAPTITGMTVVLRYHFLNLFLLLLPPRNNYLKTFFCKWLVLRIVTWSWNCLQLRIIISCLELFTKNDLRIK